MTVTILKPRLDVSFKEGHVPKERGPIIPIRQHWENFANVVFRYHELKGDSPRIVELPLWQMNDNVVFKLATESNLIYIPHRQKFQHNIDNALFYMQTVFPEFFTVDKDGWGAHMSYVPIDYSEVEPNHELWNKLQERKNQNVSKFDQPNSQEIKIKDYWLFVCQIPHDQVILQSSKVSVADALLKSIRLAKKNYKTLVVKSHPVNPHAMAELYSIATSHMGVIWIDDISIHNLLENCELAIMVNSGVGFEAMLHEKPILTFGNSEYKNVVNNFYTDNHHINMSVNTDDYKKFMTKFFERLVYTGEKDGKFYNNVTNGLDLGRHQIYG